MRMEFSLLAGAARGDFAPELGSRKLSTAALKMSWPGLSFRSTGLVTPRCEKCCPRITAVSGHRSVHIHGLVLW